MSEIYEDDIGATIIIDLDTTNIPVSTDILVIVENPYGATAEWTIGVGELNRTTGLITHSTLAGDLPYPGEYKVQCIRQDTGVDFGSGIGYFKVFARL